LKNGTYRVYTDPGTLDDGVIVALIGPDGKSVMDWNVGDKLSYEAWTASEAGEYYLWVRSFDPSASGAFSIGLDQIVDDYGNSADEAAAITVGTSVEGSAQYAADEDWFKLDVVAGENYVFNLSEHEHVEPRSMFYRRRKSNPPSLSLSVLDANGEQITGGTTLTTGRDVRFEWTAITDATVYLSVSADWFWAETPYTVRVDTANTDPN